MPTINYDFCKGKTYDVRMTPSQVGGLTEYFRKSVADWRTSIPVFSFAGTGDQPIFDISGIIDPFGNESAFQILYEKDALLMHYGSPFHSSTILHYAERISDRLSYRYDKIFPGKVITTDGKERDLKLNYHVRPLNRHLDYHWDKIENDLAENQIVSIYEEGRSRMSLCKIKNLIDFWIDRIEQDTLYLLDNESKMWVEPLLNKLGRPFLISDFEIPELF